MSKLRPIDRFQIAATVAFIVLGGITLVRAVLVRAPVLAYIVGAAFVALGGYRAGFILRALRRGERGE